MKKKSEIVKMRVMDMLNGNEAGKVQNIVIHPDTKAVVLLLNVGSITDFHMLKRDQIIGINDFIMVKTPKAVVSTKEDAEAFEELSQYYDIMGLDVVADDGCMLGAITDIIIDEKKLCLEEIILENGMIFTREDILSISNEFLFVHMSAESDEESGFLDDFDDAASYINKKSPYIIGKKLIGDVASADGLFSCEAGTVITEEIVESAQAHNAFADLIINVEG